MGETRAATRKPVLSLSTVTTCMGGGYYFGDRLGEQCIFYMNFTGATALTVWFVCVVMSGVIGAVIGLTLDKFFFVKNREA